MQKRSSSLALSVDDLGTCIFVLLLGDPLGLEGGEGAESGTTGPDGEVSIGRGDDGDTILLGALGRELLLESIGETGIESGTTGEDDVGVEVRSNIEIALLDGLVGELMHTLVFGTLLHNIGAEETLRGHEPGSVDLNDRAIRKLVGLLVLFGSGSGSLRGLVVEGDEAKFFLHPGDGLLPGTLATDLLEAVSGEELDHGLSDGSTSDEVLLDGMGNGEALIDGDSVSNTITGVDDETSGTAIGVEGKDSLDGDVHTLDLESLEHDGSHPFSVRLGVAGSLSEKHVMLLRVDSELVGESVLPDLLHVVPVLDDTGLDGVSELEDTLHLLGLITDILGLALSADQLLVSSGTTNDGRELDGGGAVTSKTGLQDTGTVINDDVLVFTHFVIVL